MSNSALGKYADTIQVPLRFLYLLGDKMKEIWRDIKGYEGLYQASNLGNIRSLDRKDGRGFNRKGFVMSPIPAKTGYLNIHLSKQGKGKTFQIHRLVAEAFLPNPENLQIINHKDENPQNNVVDNLEWCTYKYNSNYGKMTHDFRSKIVSAEKHPRRKLDWETVEKIRKLYKRKSKEFGCRGLSEKFGVCQTQIGNIVRGTSWRKEV